MVLVFLTPGPYTLPKMPSAAGIPAEPTSPWRALTKQNATKLWRKPLIRLKSAYIYRENLRTRTHWRENVCNSSHHKKCSIGQSNEAIAQLRVPPTTSKSSDNLRSEIWPRAMSKTQIISVVSELNSVGRSLPLGLSDILWVIYVRLTEISLNTGLIRWHSSLFSFHEQLAFVHRRLLGLALYKAPPSFVSLVYMFSNSTFQWPLSSDIRGNPEFDQDY